MVSTPVITAHREFDTVTYMSSQSAFVRAMSLVGVLALLLSGLAWMAPSRAEAQAAPGCVGWTSGGVTYTTRRMQYTSDGTLHLVGCGETFTLTDILTGIQNNTIVGSEPLDAIQLVDPAAKTWMLNVKLNIEEGATLNLIGGSGDVNWLRLKSGSAGIVWIKALNSTLLIQNTRISSWDPATGTFDYTDPGAPGTDETPGGGLKPRSFIAARSELAAGRAWTAPTACNVNGGTRDAYEARMDVINSRVDYLGYNGAEAYGVSWKVYTRDASLLPPNSRELYNRADIFGTISNSTFSENYFGNYIFGGYCMSVMGSSYADNYYYGLDPHDDTDFMTVSGNTFTRNAGHGFICSVYCNDLVLTNNQALNNGKHGLMIHRRTDGALIEGNVSNGNGDTGLAIFDSYGAVVRNNRIENNGIAAVRLSVGSSDNLIENNTLTGPGATATTSGYVIYSFMGTDLPTTGSNRRIVDNTFRDNTITGFKSPVIKFSDATGNTFEGNTITAGPSLTTFEFRDGVGNVVDANSPSGETTVNTLQSSTSQPAARSVLRDAPIGKSVVVKNSPSGGASTTVNDSRSYVWKGSPVRAVPGSTSGTLTAPSTTITPLDFVVEPDANAVTVTVSTWATAAPYNKAWLEAAPTNPGTVDHRVGNLLAGSCYEVKVGSASLGGFVATGSGSAGRIAFTFSGQYPETTSLSFTVAASATACSPVTSTPTATVTATATATAISVPGPASMQLSPVKGKFNDWIQVSLAGFTPNSAVTVRWQDGTTLATVNASANGTAQTSFRTPLAPYGDYRVEAEDEVRRIAQAQLRVIPRVNLAPTSGAAGSQTRVYLYGYAANERVEIRWYETATSYSVLTTLTIASNGRASRVVTVPAGASLGSHKVMGKVIGVARSASLPFTVTAGGAAASDEPSVEPTARIEATGTATPTPSDIETMAATPPATGTATATPIASATATPTVTVDVVETATPTEIVTPTETASPTETLEALPETPAAEVDEPAATMIPATEQPAPTATETAFPSDVVPVVGVSRSANSANGWTALDGDPSTVWGTTVEPPGRLAILTLDLGATVEVDGVRIIVGPDGFSGILAVEVSTDRQTWTAAADPSAGELVAGEWSSYAFAGPAQARFVRLVVVNPGELTSLGGVAEIEVVDSN